MSSQYNPTERPSTASAAMRMTNTRMIAALKVYRTMLANATLFLAGTSPMELALRCSEKFGSKMNDPGSFKSVVVVGSRARHHSYRLGQQVGSTRTTRPGLTGSCQTLGNGWRVISKTSLFTTPRLFRATDVQAYSVSQVTWWEDRGD